MRHANRPSGPSKPIAERREAVKEREGRDELEVTSRVSPRGVGRAQRIAPQAEPRVVGRVTVVQPPPAPSEQMPPAPAAVGYSWVPGHYVWRDSSWHWEAGQWRAGSIRPMPPALQE